MASLQGTQSGANLAGSGLDCSLALPPRDPSRAECVAAFAADVRAALADPALALAEDDRSALYSSLFDEREDAKDAEGARRVADAWVADLDAAASRAQSPEQRTALDPDRLSAFDAANRVQDAVPMLEQSEKDFPKDYNPPARLAVVYLKLQRYDEAMTAADRALERVYGPRRIRVCHDRRHPAREGRSGWARVLERGHLRGRDAEGSARRSRSSRSGEGSTRCRSSRERSRRSTIRRRRRRRRRRPSRATC
jgi:tetratricopeptide (TPR) repeat protein